MCANILPLNAVKHWEVSRFHKAHLTGQCFIFCRKVITFVQELTN